MKNFINENNNEKKKNLLSRLVKYAVHPHGYTFLSYLVNDD